MDSLSPGAPPSLLPRKGISCSACAQELVKVGGARDAKAKRFS